MMRQVEYARAAEPFMRIISPFANCIDAVRNAARIARSVPEAIDDGVENLQAQAVDQVRYRMGIAFGKHLYRAHVLATLGAVDPYQHWSSFSVAEMNRERAAGRWFGYVGRKKVDYSDILI